MHMYDANVQHVIYPTFNQEDFYRLEQRRAIAHKRRTCLLQLKERVQQTMCEAQRTQVGYWFAREIIE